MINALLIDNVIGPKRLNSFDITFEDFDSEDYYNLYKAAHENFYAPSENGRGSYKTINQKHDVEWNKNE